ncbi:MAG TPA: hypothetical protein VGK06_04935 [Methanosarcina sp.]|jgi:hypothetical protein
MNNQSKIMGLLKSLEAKKMLKIKKILGILLALCFVMSVTAATVGATPNAVNKDVKKFDNDNKQVTKPVTKPVSTVVKKPVTTVVKKPVTKPAPEPRP